MQRVCRDTASASQPPPTTAGPINYHWRRLAGKPGYGISEPTAYCRYPDARSDAGVLMQRWRQRSRQSLEQRGALSSLERWQSRRPRPFARSDLTSATCSASVGFFAPVADCLRLDPDRGRREHFDAAFLTEVLLILAKILLSLAKQ